MIGRWCVPVFIMISGALFLGQKETSVKTMYFKYILRVLVAYFFWSFIYYIHSGNTVQEQLMTFIKPGKIEAVSKIITGSSNHLWFIPIIIGLYICTPILKEITKNKKVTNYFLIISFIFYFLIPETTTIINDFFPNKFLPLVNSLYTFITSMPIGMITNYVFYFILGYKISSIKLEKSKRNKIYLLGIISYLFTILITYLVSTKNNEQVTTYYQYTTVNVALESIAIFVLFKNIKFTNIKLNKIITNISRYSFGIYLVHLIFINHFTKVGFVILPSILFLSIPITTIFVFVLSYIVVFLIDKIPFVKKYII